MESILGIIGEYNPFHNGHLYQLHKSIELVNAKRTVLILSGNYVQRGDCALIDKWKRTEMALKNGVDLVIELPILCSISSAEIFASSAIKVLNSLKVVNYLSFGSECGSIEILSEFANVLSNEPPEFKALLQHELSKGISFLKARENALLLYLNDILKYSNILNCPNNTLGLEYLISLKNSNSKIRPLTIKRQFAEYNSLESINGFASATAIREMIYNNDYDNLFSSMPQSSYEILMEALRSGEFVCGLQDFEKEILFLLRCMSKESIANLPAVSEGLENSIKEAASTCNTLEELIQKVKSKRFTRTRIQRILLYALLGYTKEDMNFVQENIPYIRVLGFTETGKSLLSTISKSNKKLKIVTSVKHFTDRCKNKKILNLLQKDIRSTDIYTLGYRNNSQANLDYTKRLIRM